jgi:uncharacterized membrane protein HdeD (DUF308 family)
MLFPETSATVIVYMLAISLVLYGTSLIFGKKNMFNTSNLGLVVLIIGVVLVINPSIFTSFISVIIGLYMVISSVIRLRISQTFKTTDSNAWLVTVITSVLAIICGIILMTNTNLGFTSLTFVIGLLIAVYSMISLINLIIFKKKANDIVKELTPKK